MVAVFRGSSNEAFEKFYNDYKTSHVEKLERATEKNGLKSFGEVRAHRAARRERASDDKWLERGHAITPRDTRYSGLHSRAGASFHGGTSPVIAIPATRVMEMHNLYITSAHS
ncbi:hypothetical protein EVAR_62664_1 [Eumeta japonica]|uniref:Uncharacterized protein n=1 Tax=Eumeta variegata TaxID=151549 RepID=A0A4C1Z097_EUMVA|nr:hypothetical protein EVAR_62664_1 [Eumeta japonica]